MIDLTVGPPSPPCPSCGQAPLERHLADCAVMAKTRRPFVHLTPAARRWQFRARGCGVRQARTRYGFSQCRGHATLWMVGPRGGILGRWCATHEGQAMRYYLAQPPGQRGELRDAAYQLRSTDEELAMWAISNGPDVKPWYGPASRASTGG